MIKNYIVKLTKEDLKVLATNNNISYTEEELNIIYNFIKNNYQDLLNEKAEVFSLIKSKISPSLYKQLLNLYVTYKQKYL